MHAQYDHQGQPQADQGDRQHREGPQGRLDTDALLHEAPKGALQTGEAVARQVVGLDDADAVHVLLNAVPRVDLDPHVLLAQPVLDPRREREHQRRRGERDEHGDGHERVPEAQAHEGDDGQYEPSDHLRHLMGDRGLQQQKVAHDHVHEVAGVAPGEVAQRKPAQFLRQLGPPLGRGLVGVPVAGPIGRDLRREHHEHPDDQERGEPPQLRHVRSTAGRPGREHGADHLDGDAERDDVHQVGHDRVEDRLAQLLGVPYGDGPKQAVLHATSPFLFPPSFQLPAPT